jgi:hypothetical protein
MTNFILDSRKLLLLPVVLALILGTGLVVEGTLAQEVTNTGSSDEVSVKINKNLEGDGTKISGHITAKVFDKDGNLIQQTESDNLVVDVGLDGIVDQTFGSTLQSPQQIFDFIHIGTGSVFAPNATQTALEIPLGGACVRVQDASVAVDSTVSGETTATVEASFAGVDCSGSIVEAGIFNNVTSGVMLARATFGIVTIGISDTLTVSYEITIT